MTPQMKVIKKALLITEIIKNGCSLKVAERIVKELEKQDKWN
jgi:hypothetical protein